MCGYVWIRMKFKFVYAELHRYIKAIIFLATITLLHHKLKKGMMPLPNLILLLKVLLCVLFLPFQSDELLTFVLT